MLGHKITIARVYGMPIQIDLSWLVLLALVSWSLATGYFPEKILGESKALYWAMGLVSALLLFASILLHELGHSLVARKHAVPVRSITLFLFGGVSEIGEEPKSPRAEIEITLGGWAASAGIALVCYGLAWVLRGEGRWMLAAQTVAEYLFTVNLLLLMFNAIPGFPLDGGRILRAIIWQVTGSFRKATRWCSQIGSFIGLGMIFLGVMWLFAGSFVGGMWLALIGLFLHGAAQATFQQMLLRRALAGVQVGQLMTREVITVPAQLTVDQLANNYFMNYRYHSFPVLKNEQLAGLVAVHDIKRVPQSRWEDTRVEAIMEQLPVQCAVSPATDVLDLLQCLAVNHLGRVPVVEEGRLVGIISRQDIMRLLALKLDLTAEGD